MGVSFSKKGIWVQKQSMNIIINSAYSNYIDTKLQIKKTVFILNFSKKGISGVKLKKLTSLPNSAHFGFMETWDQRNKFCLKSSFFIINPNCINKQFQKFLSKPQLACFVCSLTCMPSLTPKYSLFHSKLSNFITSWKIIENTIKL